MKENTKDRRQKLIMHVYEAKDLSQDRKGAGVEELLFRPSVHAKRARSILLIFMNSNFVQSSSLVEVTQLLCIRLCFD